MGDMIDAATALECNMVNRVVAADKLQEETSTYAERLAKIDRETLAGTKLALRRGMEVLGIPAALRNGVDVLAPLYATETVSGKRFIEITRKEGLGAALKWRMSQFD